MDETTQSLFRVTEVELSYRSRVKPSERPKVNNSKDAYKILLAHWDMNKIELVEQFKILLLDRNNACLGISEIATGGIAGCIVDPKIIFSTALKAKASSILLAHNHPSGNLIPSIDDERITKKICSGAKFFDMNVPDHLIISPYDYYSMTDEGDICCP